VNASKSNEAEAIGLRAQRTERWLWVSAFGILAASLVFSQVMLQKATEEPFIVEETEAVAAITPEPTAAEVKVVVPSTLDIQKKRLIVKEGDNLSSLFAREGISQELVALLMGAKEANALKQLKPDQEIFLSFDETGDLFSLKTQLHPTSDLLIKKSRGSFISEEIQKAQTVQLAHRSAVIKTSLFRAAQDANINDKLILALADIFAFDIDFASDLQPNDSFKIIYEEKFIDGKKANSGNILAAEFINEGTVHRAVRFTDENGHSRYYTPEGLSLSQGFMRTPVKFSRISSTFQLARKHPILHHLRAHKGVDYAAPTGTPVRATADATILEIGWKGGYGRTIVLQHGKMYSTLYGHLSGFASGMRHGKAVKQGDIIGYVGSTGLATGPHLHYEFRVNGVHKNPLTAALPKSLPLASQYTTQFKQHATKMTYLLAHPENQTFARENTGDLLHGIKG